MRAPVSKMFTVGFENNGWPRPADAGIDNAEKDGFRCKPFGKSRQQLGRCLGVTNRRISEEVDRGHARRHLVHHCLHLTGYMAPATRNP